MSGWEKNETEALDVVSAERDDYDADPVVDDGPDRVRGLWEALAFLEREALSVGGEEVSVLIGCARESLERRWGGYPPPEPGYPNAYH